MGKPTGFMEYDRCEARSVEPKERIKNFDEFQIFLSTCLILLRNMTINMFHVCSPYPTLIHLYAML